MTVRSVALLALVSALAPAAAFAGTLDAPLAALLRGPTAVARARQGEHTLSSALPAPRFDRAGRVQVYVHPARGVSVQSLAAGLTALGARDMVPAALLHVVQAWIPRNELPAVAALDGVQRVSTPEYARPRPGVPHPLPARTISAAVANGVVPSALAIDSQAPVAMQAPVLSANGGYGAGVKVGVISSDIAGLAASQAAGYLPAAIWTDPGYPGTAAFPDNPGEGTALLEIVHAVAPDATLGFCAPTTSVELLTCFKDFINWGANIIASDMGFSTPDMFAAGLADDGSAAWAAEQLAQAHPDVAFVNAAGNEAQDYFQAPYIAGPGASLNGVAYASLMDFGAAAGGASATRLPVTFNYVSAFTPLLEWNDPVNTAPDSFVMALVDPEDRVLAMGTKLTTSDGRPGVSLIYEPLSARQPAYLEIACKVCRDPVTLKLNGFADGAATFTMNLGGAVGYGQAVIPATLTVGVARITAANPLAVISEFFTGPGPFLYGDFGATATEAKPDLSGIDNVTVSGAGGFNAGEPVSGGGVNFLGTSAAVPNVAGLLADLMSGNPGLAASVYYTALRSAADRSVFPAPGAASGYVAAAAGAGLARGVRAWNSISLRPIPYITAVDPSQGEAGKAFALTVSGYGFANGTVVNLNGTTLATTAPGAGTLIAQVPAALAVSGIDTLQVANPSPAATISNTVNYIVGNPVPAIVGWSPQQATAGSPAFTLYIHGAEFVDGAVLEFDGTQVPTTYVSTTDLTAVIPASAVAQAGDYPLAVVNPAPGGVSSTVTFSVQARSAPPPKSSGGGGGVGVLALLLLAMLSIIARCGIRCATR